TVDDTSPFISYAPPNAWNHHSGADAQGYVNSTCSRTNVQGAVAEFSFSGTGFWIYGAKKVDYGNYILLLDNEVITYDNATLSSDEFNQFLGGQNGLEDTQHLVTMMADGTMDIDTVMLELTGQDKQ
ncbi:uncharacterized protein BXZ73DRAFT_12858, partial [Epithele typhae]|uniref:uncharacterized protein n=1 Tax=Epithele typhae TaxID=378194 RepID=UPI002007C79E